MQYYCHHNIIPDYEHKLWSEVAVQRESLKILSSLGNEKPLVNIGESLYLKTNIEN